MATEYRSTTVRVGPWPSWFLRCFVEADTFARRKGYYAYAQTAYRQKGHGDLVIASRAGSADPADWTSPGKRASFFFLGSTVPTEAKDWEYAGVQWRGEGEKSLFWLSYFIANRRTLRKDGEGFRFCWGQAGVQNGGHDAPAEQQELLRQVAALPVQH